MQLYPVLIRKSSTAFYHIQESPETQRRVLAVETERAEARVDAYDRMLYDAFNVHPRYEAFRDRVTCPACGQTQCWSMLPLELKKADWLRPWIVAVVINLLAFLVPLFIRSDSVGFRTFWLVLAALCLVLLMIPMAVYFIRRKRAFDKVRITDFRPPMYFNKSNQSDLDTMLNDGAGTEEK